MDRGTVYGLSTLAGSSKPITYLSAKEADHHHQPDHQPDDHHHQPDHQPDGDEEEGEDEDDDNVDGHEETIIMITKTR